MKKFLNKILVIIIGLLVILIILEIFLRIVGFSYLIKDTYRNNNQPIKKAKYTILCLGDSHTYGFGVEHQYSYPSRLQAFFDKNSKVSVNVINYGIVTQNTTQVLNSLQKSINDTKPDIIILLSGGANHWNYYGYNSSISYPSLSGFLNKLFFNIRVYKLFVLFSKNLGSKLFFSDRDEIRQEELKQIQEKLNYYMDKLKTEPQNPENYFYLGLYNYKVQKIDEAIKWLEKGIEVEPHCGNNYILINFCFNYYSHDETPAINWLKKGIEKYPNNPLLYKLILENYHKIGKKDELKEWTSKLSAIRGNLMNIYFAKINQEDKNFLEKRAIAVDPEFNEVTNNVLGMTHGFLNFGNIIHKQEIVTENKKYVLSWIKADLENIFQICYKNNIKLILQSYAIKPENDFWTTTSRTVNDALKEFAEENAVPFVDNEAVFDKLEYRGWNYFNKCKSDTHPNKEGYEIMAKNLYDYIVANNLIN
jgi:lysophospholipase L1-like esterase